MSDPQAIKPVPAKQLGPLLTVHLNKFTQSLLPPKETFDSIRAEYILAILVETLATHAAAAAKKTPAQLPKFEAGCAEELAETLESNLDEELEAKFSDAKARQAALQTFLRDAMDISYGRSATVPATDTAPKSAPAATPVAASMAGKPPSSANAPPGFAKPSAATPASAPTAPASSSASSRCDPLVSILLDIFASLPRPQVEAVFLACGGNLDPSSALDVAGEILAQCMSGGTGESTSGKTKDELDAWPIVMQALEADERQVYKNHLQAHKYELSRSGGGKVESRNADSPSFDAQQSFYYDQPESSLSGLKRQTSTSSTASSSSSSSSGPSARDDAYYQSEEFLAIKKQLVEQYTYDQSKPGTFHRPHVKFESRPKHHARYLENKVVNMKGEKITVLVDPEEEARAAAWKASHKPLKIIHTKKAGGKGHKII